MLRILTDRDSMLVAEQQLDADIEGATATQREQGESVLRVQRWLSLGLGVTTLRWIAPMLC